MSADGLYEATSYKSRQMRADIILRDFGDKNRQNEPIVKDSAASKGIMPLLDGRSSSLQGLSLPKCPKPPSRLVPASSALPAQVCSAGLPYPIISSCFLATKNEMRVAINSVGDIDNAIVFSL